MYDVESVNEISAKIFQDYDILNKDHYLSNCIYVGYYSEFNRILRYRVHPS